MLKRTALIAAVGFATVAEAAPLRELEPADKGRNPHAERTGKPVTSAHVPINQRFRTLDDYLAYLEKTSALDNPWYRQIKPGLYRLETTNLRGPYSGKRLFTREELARKFGFGS